MSKFVQDLTSSLPRQGQRQPPRGETSLLKSSLFFANASSGWTKAQYTCARLSYDIPKRRSGHRESRTRCACAQAQCACPHTRTLTPFRHSSASWSDTSLDAGTFPSCHAGCSLLSSPPYPQRVHSSQLIKEQPHLGSTSLWQIFCVPLIWLNVRFFNREWHLLFLIIILSVL